MRSIAVVGPTFRSKVLFTTARPKDIGTNRKGRPAGGGLFAFDIQTP